MPRHHRPSDGPEIDPSAAVAEWRVDDAARARGRAHWLRRGAAEEATIAAVVAGAAERGRGLVLELVGGRRVVGRAWSVSPAVTAVRATTGEDVLVALGAVAAVRRAPASSDGNPTGHGRTIEVPGDGSLAEALAQLVGERPVVTAREADGRVLACGELLEVGRDLAEVATEQGTVTIALGAAATVAWRGS